MMRAILEAAKVLHFRVAHFRAGRTLHGWRTPVEGDPGFVDAVMVQPSTGRCFFVELKARRGRLTPDQERWGFDLAATGQRWIVCRGRAGLTALLDEMAAP
jgi:hypothetical protein